MKTSEPYYTVEWFINGNRVGYSTGDNVKTEAKFSPIDSDYLGSPFGIVYTIKAVAWSLADDENNHQSVTDSYDVTVYTPLKMDSFFGGYTYAEMEVWVDVGWNGMTAEIVVGGLIKNWELEKDIRYGFTGRYKVGRLTKILEQQDEVYLNEIFLAFGRLHNFENGVLHTAWRGGTDSHTLGNLVEGHKYFVESLVTMKAYHPGHEKQQDEAQVEDREVFSSEDIADN